MKRYNDRQKARDYTDEAEEVYQPEQVVEEPVVEREREREPSKSHVSVKLRKKYNDSWLNFKDMLHEFKRRVDHSGILREHKERQTYESKGVRARKTRREIEEKITMDSLRQKIEAGERVEGHGGLIKRIMSDIKKDKEKDKMKKKREFDNPLDYSLEMN